MIVCGDHALPGRDAQAPHRRDACATMLLATLNTYLERPSWSGASHRALHRNATTSGYRLRKVTLPDRFSLNAVHYLCDGLGPCQPRSNLSSTLRPIRIFRSRIFLSEFSSQRRRARVLGSRSASSCSICRFSRSSVISECRSFRIGVFSRKDALNGFLALGRPAWSKAREVIQHLLAADTTTLRDDGALRGRVFHAQKDVTMQLPARIGDYTDFYSSYHHAHNVGTMLRGPENALMPNWKWLPVAYHGRASSIVASGADVRRPHGQIKPPDARGPRARPRFLVRAAVSITNWRRRFSSDRETRWASRSRSIARAITFSAWS